MSSQDSNGQRSAIMNTVGAALSLVLTSLGILVSYLSDNLLLRYICISLCISGLIISILLILFLWLDFRLKKLVLSVVSYAPVVETHKEEMTPTMREDLIIVLRYKGSPMDNMYQYILKLNNIGHNTINEQDFNEHQIIIKIAAKVLGAKILEPDIKDAIKLPIDEDKVCINPFILKSHESITLRVFVDRIVNDGIILDESNSKLGFKVKKAEESYTKNSRISMILRVLKFGMILILCASSIVTYVFMGKSNHEQFLFAFLIIITIAFFYLVINGIMNSFVNIIIDRNLS